MKHLGILLCIPVLFCLGCRKQGPENFLWPKHNLKAKYDFRLPDEVDECSGAISWTDSTFLTHNDDGPARLYEISYKGNLVREIDIPDAENEDWEEVTHDQSGNIYIADLGNNRNKRKDLGIYSYRPGAASSQRINLRYADQFEFPPAEKYQNFDSEALFWYEGFLYALSKNRGYHTVKLYQIQPKAGNQVAIPIDSAKFFEPVTSAAVSPNKQVLAILAYSKLYLYKLVPGERILSHPIDSIPFSKSGQSEAIWWRDQKHLYVANEAQRVFCFERMDGSGF